MSILKHCSLVSVLIPRAFYSTKKNNNNMSSKSYWDLFYTNKTTNFEWLLDSTCLEHLTHKLNESNQLTLIADIGCGSSHFSSQLSTHLNSKNLLLCVDFSLLPLKFLKETNSKSKTLISDYIQCNCKRLPFRNELFDLIIDKGYLDSVLKQISLVTIEKAIHSTHESLKALVDKLETNKYLVQITDEQPELRFDLLDDFKLKYSCDNLSYFYKEIPFNGFVYYAYFISKQ